MGDIWTDDVHNICKILLLAIYSPFQASVLFPCPLKTSEKLRFSYVLREWEMDTWLEMS